MAKNESRSPSLKPNTLVLDPQQSYKRLEEDALIRVLRKACRHVAVHYLPYRLSPVVLGFPGLFLHLFLLAAVHTFARAEWMYGLWVVCRLLHFCLDSMDGTLARRNGTQSTARHFWDHWVDVANSAMAVMIVAQLAPRQGAHVLPYLVLTATGQLFFYLGLCRYFATGIMRDPYINHLWNYVFCLFLGLSVCVHGLEVLDAPGFQTAYTALSLLAFGLGAWSLLQDVRLTWRSPLACLPFYVRTLAAPVLILGLYVLWLRHWEDALTARALVCLAMSSLAIGVHAHQLLNKPPAWLTLEGGLYLLVIPASLLPAPLRPEAHLALLLLMVGAMITRLSHYLREMVAQYPEIGFPLLWLPESYRPAVLHVSNKLT